MQSVSLKYVLLGIIVVLILGSTGYYFYSRQPVAEVTPSAPAGGAAETVATSTPQANPQPQVDLNLKDRSTLAVRWQNLPGETEIVNIYRSLKDKNQWTRWQAISVSQKGASGEKATLTNGTTDIAIGRNENLSSYSYYFQAISGSGSPLFTSPSAQSGSPQSSRQLQTGQNSSLNFGGSGSSSGSAPIGGFNLVMAANNTSTNQTQTNPFNQGSAGSSSTHPQPQPPTNPAPNGTLPVNPPAPSVTTSTTPKSIPTGTVSVAVQGIYYSPDGTPTGSGTQEASFWVLRVHENIEIGWQKLPTHTDRIIVYRSASLSGPWIKLLEQRGPVLDQPSFLRLVDNTVGSAYYYRLTAYGEGTVLATYGPVLLPAE